MALLTIVLFATQGLQTLKNFFWLIFMLLNCNVPFRLEHYFNTSFKLFFALNFNVSVPFPVFGLNGMYTLAVTGT